MNRDELCDGMLVERNGVQFRVTRAYIPDRPGEFPKGRFELVRVTPPAPFAQAPSLADKYDLAVRRC